jgi:hypothetical protein
MFIHLYHEGQNGTCIFLYGCIGYANPAMSTGDSWTTNMPPNPTTTIKTMNTTMDRLSLNDRCDCNHDNFGYECIFRLNLSKKQPARGMARTERID